MVYYKGAEVQDFYEKIFYWLTVDRENDEICINKNLISAI